MNKVFIYETDDGFDIKLSSRELTDEERYCPHCGEYAKLLTETTDITEMINYFPRYGYTPDTAKYQELIDRFSELRGD